MQAEYGKKITGTSLFIVLVAAALLTAVAFAQAAFNPISDNGHGLKLGHIYGVGNGGTPPAP